MDALLQLCQKAKQQDPEAIAALGLSDAGMTEPDANENFTVECLQQDYITACKHYVVGVELGRELLTESSKTLVSLVDFAVRSQFNKKASIQLKADTNLRAVQSSIQHIQSSMEKHHFQELTHITNLASIIQNASDGDGEARKVLAMTSNPKIDFPRRKSSPSGRDLTLTYMTAKELELVGNIMDDSSLTTVNHGVRRYVKWLNRKRPDNQLELQFHLDDACHSLERAIQELKEVSRHAELKHRKLNGKRTVRAIDNIEDEVKDPNFDPDEDDTSLESESDTSSESNSGSSPSKTTKKENLTQKRP